MSEVLRASAPRSTVDFDRLLQGVDGGFPTCMTGAPSEAGMTAAGLNAHGLQHELAVQRVLDFLPPPNCPM
jgi:hypothetical protein